MGHAIRAPKRRNSRRQYGPLIELALRIAEQMDGYERSEKTVYAVLYGKVKSEIVSRALEQAAKHPDYIAWQQNQMRQWRKRANAANRRLRAAEKAVKRNSEAA